MEPITSKFFRPTPTQNFILRIVGKGEFIPCGATSSLLGLINMKLSYQEKIHLLLQRAKKEKDAEAIVYYLECFNFVACVDFNFFKTSSVYESWKKKNKEKIEDENKNIRRFA
jgi:hypothetical protein